MTEGCLEVIQLTYLLYEPKMICFTQHAEIRPGIPQDAEPRTAQFYFHLVFQVVKKPPAKVKWFSLSIPRELYTNTTRIWLLLWMFFSCACELIKKRKNTNLELPNKPAGGFLQKKTWA